MSTSPTETSRRSASSVLCDILAEIAAALLADPSFADPGTEILTEDKGDIDTDIAQKLGALGLCCTVMFSGANGAKPSMPGPVFDKAHYVVEICENALTNRSQGGRTALETADHAARILHLAELRSGRRLLVTDLRKFPSAVPPADNCYHVELTLSNVSLNRKVPTI